MESETFDAALGWDGEQIARDFNPEIKTAWAQSYGDSFTYCSEVDSAESWQSQFEEITAEKIVNLGVPGYGLDQALLKFERYGSRYRTRFVIIGLNRFTYYRTLSYHTWHMFDHADKFMFAFKPIFTPGHGGYELTPPPCRSAGCIFDLLKNRPQSLERFMSEHDYWYRLNNSRPYARFPHTLAFVHSSYLRLKEKFDQRTPANRYFLFEPHSSKLVRHLIDRIADRCEKIGARPLFLLLYSAKDLTWIRQQGRGDRLILQHMKRKGYPFVDMNTYIPGKLGGEADFSTLSAPEGHLNRHGNRMVAEALAAYCRQRAPGPAVP